MCRLPNGGPLERVGQSISRCNAKPIHPLPKSRANNQPLPPHSQNQTGRARQQTKAHNDTTTGVRPQSKSISIILVILVILAIPSPHAALLNISKHCQLQPMRQSTRITRLVHLPHEAVLTSTLRGSLLTPLVCSSTRRRLRANLDYGNCHGVHRRRHDPAQDQKTTLLQLLSHPQNQQRFWPTIHPKSPLRRVVSKADADAYRFLSLAKFATPLGIRILACRHACRRTVSSRGRLQAQF